MNFLLEKMKELNLVTAKTEYLGVNRGVEYILALKGWKRIAEISKNNLKGNQIFVAHYFDKDSIQKTWP